MKKTKPNGFQLKQRKKQMKENEKNTSFTHPIFKNTKHIKWDDKKKNHITVTVIGECEKTNSQQTRFNPGGTSSNLVIYNNLLTWYWKDRIKGKKDLTDTNLVMEIHIPMKDINSTDDIYRITNTGDYSHLHEWNKNGEFHKLVPVVWLEEKKEYDNYRKWETYTHILNGVYMMELFGEWLEEGTKTDGPEGYINYLRDTNDVIVGDLDDDTVVVYNPKTDKTTCLSKNREQGEEIDGSPLRTTISFKKLMELYELGIPIEQLGVIG